MCKHIYNPETQYPKGTPFTYLISWSELNISYYGVRYKKTCHPDDLWNIYFTSSTPLKKFRKLNGDPDIIKVDFIYDTKEEAISSEYHYIKENNLVKDPNWLNIGNGGENFCNLGHSEATKKKIGDANKGKTRIVTEETKQKMSDTRKGKPQSAELIKKRADANRGNRHSEATKKKIGESSKGRLKSEETRQKLSDSSKGRIRINNGIKVKFIKPEQLQEFLDLGWVFGGLPVSAETKQKLSKIKKGKKQSPETIQKRLETKRLIKLAKLQLLFLIIFFNSFLLSPIK